MPGQHGGTPHPGPRSEQGGYLQPEQHSMYLLCSGQYASCVHAGLSCLVILEKNYKEVLNLAFDIFVPMIIISPKGNIPFDLTRIQRSLHALHKVCYLSLYKKQNFEAASYNAISSAP